MTESESVAQSVDRLRLSGVVKTYAGGVRAVDHVDIATAPGSIHALLGENGAGKSTLVKLVYGVLQPDEGEIRLDGEKVVMSAPKVARRLGVGMVFQHFSLFEALTVAENLILGFDEKIDAAQLQERMAQTPALRHLPLRLDRIVATLSVAERQRIEIVRALLGAPRLLIMDEPTSVLTVQETRRLFTVLRDLAASGCSILYISHKLADVRELCEKATILRGGRVVGVCDPRRESPGSMAAMMVGERVGEIKKSGTVAFGEPCLEIRRLSVPGEGAFGVALRDLSFTLRAGEILGVAGVAGNGQTELAGVLNGETPCSPADAIRLKGRPIGDRDAAGRRALGLCSIPEERNGHAAIGAFSLIDNVLLSARRRLDLAPKGVISFSAADAYARGVVSAFSVKAEGVHVAASSLSGGNLQKFIVGREIMQEPDILIASQPSWGVDAAAAAFIHRSLLDLAAKGAGIVVISQDLDELMILCDAVAVIHEGRLSPFRPIGDVDAESIGLLMGGGVLDGASGGDDEDDRSSHDDEPPHRGGVQGEPTGEPTAARRSHAH